MSKMDRENIKKEDISANLPRAEEPKERIKKVVKSKDEKSAETGDLSKEIINIIDENSDDTKAIRFEVEAFIEKIHELSTLKGQVDELKKHSSSALDDQRSKILKTINGLRRMLSPAFRELREKQNTLADRSIELHKEYKKLIKAYDENKINEIFSEYGLDMLDFFPSRESDRKKKLAMPDLRQGIIGIAGRQHKLEEKEEKLRRLKEYIAKKKESVFYPFLKFFNLSNVGKLESEYQAVSSINKRDAREIAEFYKELIERAGKDLGMSEEEILTQFTDLDLGGFIGNLDSQKLIAEK